ncbi:hypothetical protein ACFL1B_04120 [Nanoarchaeota archaeon]
MRLIFFFAFLILFITSCSPEVVEPEVSGFIGGKQGLQAHVLEGAPPTVVTDMDSFPFSIVMMLDNVGESSVGPGTQSPLALVRLTGILPELWNLPGNLQVRRVQHRLESTKKNFDGTRLPGEQAMVEFKDLSYMSRVTGSELFTLQAEVCYDYATHANLLLCLKDDLRDSMQDSSLCSIRSKIVPMNSGAPLQVVEADQAPVAGNKIQVNFVVQNVGRGMFFSRSDDSNAGACTFDSRNSEMYKALIVVPWSDPYYELDCRGLDNTKPGFENVQIEARAQYGVVRFPSDSPKSITCFLNQVGGKSGRVYQDLLNIDIYYRYGELVEIPLLVQETGYWE